MQCLMADTNAPRVGSYWQKLFEKELFDEKGKDINPKDFKLYRQPSGMAPNAENRKNLPENYYEDCFGIYRMEDVPVEKIRIRAFYPEYNYIEEVPLHESQQKVKESKDGMYREYTLTVRPSRDFLQELLWHGRNLIVLKPESLRQEMIGILKDMTKSYETGECLNGEE